MTERCAYNQEGYWVRPNIGQARWLTRHNPATNPIAIKPKTVSHTADWFSWVPHPAALRSGTPSHEVFCGYVCFSDSLFLGVRQDHSWTLEWVPFPETTPYVTVSFSFLLNSPIFLANQELCEHYSYTLNSDRNKILFHLIIP